MTFKKSAPYLAAFIIFVIITIVQVSPLFNGKVINQSDIIQHKGMSKEVVDYRNAQHSEPLWTNSMFGGMPAYQVSTLYPGNWLTHIDRFFHLFIPHPGGYIFMGFLGFFILLLCLQIDPWLALVGSLAYGFSSYFFIILEVGHNSKSNAIGYLAPVLGGIVLLMRNKLWLGFALTTLFMALELNANHVQITYYGLMLYTLVFITYFILALKQKNTISFFKGIALFVAASAIAVLPNAGSLLATYEYGNYTTRGKTELTIDSDLKSNKDNITSGLDKDYAVQYSHGIGETFTFLIPNFKGGPSGLPISYENGTALKNVDPEMREQVGQMSAYFGMQDTTAGPVYLGAIVMLLAFLGLFIVDHPLKWPLLIATVLAMMLSWGKFFMGLSSFFLDYLPGYNKFRAVSMILIVAELTVPLLAVLALDKYIKTVKQARLFKLPFLKKELDLKTTLWIAGIVVGGFCLLAYVSTETVNSIEKPYEEMRLKASYKENGATDEQIASVLPSMLSNVEKARIQIVRADAFRSFVFILLTVVLLVLYRLKKINLQVLFGLLGLLITIDMWPVAGRFLKKSSFVPRSQYEAPPQKTAADLTILADTAKDFRVLNLSVYSFQDATTSYYHKSIGGYHGAKLKKYDELISFHLMKEINYFTRGINQPGANDSVAHALMANFPVLNMLNTRYIILPTRDEPVALENYWTNGNAWFISELKTVANADSEIVGLYNANTKKTALVQAKNKPAGAAARYVANGTIKLVSYQPNQLIYESVSKEKEFAVFSEIYYPKGWKAYLDGSPAEHTCVNYLLRGMEIPGGKHKIEFKFEPGIYQTGNRISLAGSLLVIVVIAAGIYMAYKKEEVLV